MNCTRVAKTDPTTALRSNWSCLSQSIWSRLREGDEGMAKEWSADPLEIPLGPMTRGRAKRFKEALNVLIRDAQVEEAHVFNSK